MSDDGQDRRDGHDGGVDTQEMSVIDLAVFDAETAIELDRPVVLGPEPDEPVEPGALDTGAVEPVESVEPVDPVEPGAVDSGAAQPVADPRFEERRAQVAVDRRRRRRRILLTIASVLFLMLLGAGAVYSPLLDVDRIEIIGSGTLTAADLAERGGLRVGDPIALLDIDDVEDRLRRDPRFVRVDVTRQFPSQISVRVTDRRPIARVAGPARGVIVGEGGVVIAVARGDEFLRTIEVAEDPPAKPGSRLPAPLAAAVDVMGSMSFEIAIQIQTVRLTPEGELIFDLGDGRTVLFGTVDEADRKLLAAKTMLGPQIDTSGLCQLDVRVPSAPTIRRKPDCDPPAPAPVVDPAAPVTDPAATAAADPATAPAAGAANPVPDPATDPATDPSAVPVDPFEPVMVPTGDDADTPADTP